MLWLLLSFVKIVTNLRWYIFPFHAAVPFLSMRDIYSLSRFGFVIGYACQRTF